MPVGPGDLLGVMGLISPLLFLPIHLFDELAKKYLRIIHIISDSLQVTHGQLMRLLCCHRPDHIFHLVGQSDLCCLSDDDANHCKANPNQTNNPSLAKQTNYQTYASYSHPNHQHEYAKSVYRPALS